MHMAAPNDRTAPSRRCARQSQKTTAPSLPVVRGVFVAGSRPSETRAIARAFAGHDVAVVIAQTHDQVLAQLRRQRWACALVDARWEIQLADELLGRVESTMFFVTDPKRAQRGHRPLPLGQADVVEILATLPT